jgi:hypothetical protein
MVATNSQEGRLSFAAKPVFIGWITLLKQLPFQLFFTVWSGGFSPPGVPLFYKIHFRQRGLQASAA